MILPFFNIFNFAPLSGAQSFRDTFGARKAPFVAPQVSGEDVPEHLRQDVGLPPDLKSEARRRVETLQFWSQL